MKKESKGVLCMLLCAAMWSIAGIFIKQIPWHPMVIGGGRGVFTVIVFLIYMRAVRMKIVLNAHSIAVAVPMCVLALMFVAANKLTTAANAVVLQYTAPVFVVIFSALVLRKKPTLLDTAAVIVTFGGMVLFFIEELSGSHLFGNVLAVASGAVMAIMYMASDRASNAERMSGLMLGHGMTAVVGIVFAFFYPPVFTVKATVSITVLGIFQLGIPYVLYGIAAGLCPPLACALLAAVEPLLNPLWVFLFDGEAPGVLALCGGVIVIAGVTAWTVLKEKLTARKNS